jgi:hypothetical protein
MRRWRKSSRVSTREPPLERVSNKMTALLERELVEP